MSSYKYTIPEIKFDGLQKKMSNFSNGNSQRGSGSILMTIFVSIIILLILFFIINLIYYIFNDCYEKKTLGEYLFGKPFDACVYEFKPTSFEEREVKDEKEVFHLSNQDYTYEQARCKCEAYGGRLATKNEIIDAYNKGASWCTYGWSAGQNAFYPTQKCVWDELQLGDPKHRFDCGIPGINGGYFANPNLKFGVNCFGIRPKGRVVRPKDPVCTEKQFCKMDINRRAASKLSTDVIAPFNQDQWSAFT